jgi:hypothetical protein
MRWGAVMLPIFFVPILTLVDFFYGYLKIKS